MWFSCTLCFVARLTKRAVRARSIQKLQSPGEHEVLGAPSARILGDESRGNCCFAKMGKTNSIQNKQKERLSFSFRATHIILSKIEHLSLTSGGVVLICLLIIRMDTTGTRSQTDHVLAIGPSTNAQPKHAHILFYRGPCVPPKHVALVSL